MPGIRARRAALAGCMLDTIKHLFTYERASVSATLLLQGDAQGLPLADASVDCIVTSPPYYRLRTYHGLQPSRWPRCSYTPVPGTGLITVPGQSVCLGSEASPAAYLSHLMLCLREMARVLKPKGVAWINLGDSMSDGRLGSFYPQGTLLGIPQQFMLAAMADGWLVRQECIYAKASPMPESVAGWRWTQAQCACVSLGKELCPKDRILVADGLHGAGGSLHGPGWRVQPDGGHPHPDCPTCRGTGRTNEVALRKGSWRHTRAHEQVFMLTKGMQYWSNGEAAKETSSNILTSRNPRSVLAPHPSSLTFEHYASFPPLPYRAPSPRDLPRAHLSVWGAVGARGEYPSGISARELSRPHR